MAAYLPSGLWTSHDECNGSGNTSLTLDNAKHIHVETSVDKSTHVYYHGATNPKEIGLKPIQLVNPCCEKINADGITSCEEFKNKLQEFYRELTLPKVAWLDEGDDLSISDHFIQLELKELKKSIAFEEIFLPVDKKRPTRILIEGQPGFGKTTLATKLAHDWATTKTYIHFKFAYFVPLRELQERSVADAIEQIGRRCDFHDNIMQIFNAHMKNTLLILDGLDEISQSARAEINKILYKQMYRDLTVVVFCRTGLFALSKEERRQLFGLTTMRQKFQDKQITTLGVTSDDNKRRFLKKFIPKSRINNVMKHLSLQWKIFDSPLLLMLLSIIIQQDENMEEIGTRTEFYKQLFNCMLKHSYAKRGHEIDGDFDLFRFDSSPNAFQQSVRQFGILSIPNILEYNLQFESNESTQEIYELGFLIKHREMTFISSRNHYEGLHLSIIEFAAAFGFWVNFNLKNCASIENYCKLMTNHYLKTEGTSLVLPFLITLMEGELDRLLSRIESFSAWFCLDFNLTVKLFSECQSINFSKSKYLKNIFSHSINLKDHRLCERNLLELLIHGCECGEIKRIEINFETNSEIFTSEIAPSCEMILKLPWQDCTIFGNVHHFSKRIPCRGSLNELLHFAASSNCKINYDAYNYGDKFAVFMPKEHILSKTKFRRLTTEISSELDKNVVIQLLQNDQVEYLKLDTFIHVDTSDFCRAAAKSKELTHLYLQGFTIDLYDLTAGGTKNYNLLSLHGCNLTCRRPLLSNKCCHHLRIESIQGIEGIVELEPSLLTFYYDDKSIEDLITKHPKWTDTNTVIRIRYWNCETNLNSAFAWKNIQTLIISTLFATDQKELATCIHKLPITNLVLDNIYVDNLNLFEHMNNLWAADNNSRLKTVVLQHSVMSSYESALDDLIKGLKCNYWQTVHFFSDQNDLHVCRKYLLPSNLRITDANSESICAELGLIPIDDWLNYEMISVSVVFDEVNFQFWWKELANRQPSLEV